MRWRRNAVPKPTTVLVTACAVAAFALSGCARQTPSETRVASGGTINDRGIRAAQRFGANGGWVMTASGLKVTENAGTSWRNITPPAIDPASLSSSDFLDAVHAWTVSVTQDAGTGVKAPAVTVLTTTDGGQTWSPAPVATSSTVENATVDFIDQQNGWLMLKLSSSANFSRGALYRTTDGGKTWSELPEPPIGDPVHFINNALGVLVGGATDTDLFTTRDGGKSWEPGIFAPALQQGTDQLGDPKLIDGNHAIIPVFENRTGAHPAESFYETTDGGKNWAGHETVMAVDQSQFVGDAVDASNWFAARVDGQAIHRTHDRGNHVEKKNVSGLPSGVAKLDFVDSQQGWAISREGSCKSFKTDCGFTTQLSVSSDGGASWRRIDPGP